MSDASYGWTDDLVEEIRDIEKLVEELEKRKPDALSELIARVERDVEHLDKELYEGKKTLEVVQNQKDNSDFAIYSRAGRDIVRMGVWLLPHEYELIGELYIKPYDSQETKRQNISFGIVAGEYGGFTYLDSYPKEVPLDEVSRQLIEPVVKAGSELNFKPPRFY